MGNLSEKVVKTLFICDWMPKALLRRLNLIVLGPNIGCMWKRCHQFQSRRLQVYNVSGRNWASTGGAFGQSRMVLFLRVPWWASVRPPLARGCGPLRKEKKCRDLGTGKGRMMNILECLEWQALRNFTALSFTLNPNLFVYD